MRSNLSKSKGTPFRISQDSVGFWNPSRGFWIPVYTGSGSLELNSGFTLSDFLISNNNDIIIIITIIIKIIFLVK